MSRAEISDSCSAHLRRTVISGERVAVFQALGEHAREDIRETLATLPEVEALRRQLDVDAALPRSFAEVKNASRGRFPAVWAELEALASGAGSPVGDLLLLNLRGDLGIADEGCTDIAWSDGRRAILGHNEDGAPSLEGRCRLLTLEVDGDPTITAWWYPGFLPSNTFVWSDAGLVFGVDHITVSRPATAPGRAFVARHAQTCATVDEAVEALTGTPSAGGFSYTIGRLGSPTIHIVETAAGHSAVVERPAGAESLLFHANHLVSLDAGLNAPHPESAGRAAILAALTAPPEPDRDWVLKLLRTDKPLGAHRNATDGDELMTLATFVVDLTADTITVVPRGGGPVEVRG